MAVQDGTPLQTHLASLETHFARGPVHDTLQRHILPAILHAEAYRICLEQNQQQGDSLGTGSLGTDSLGTDSTPDANTKNKSSPDVVTPNTGSGGAVQTPESAPTAASVLAELCRVEVNGIAMTRPAHGGEEDRNGLGLFPMASLLNHSCCPNCVLGFDKTRLKIRAIKNVSPGEELLVSYGKPPSSGAKLPPQCCQWHIQLHTLWHLCTCLQEVW